MHNLNLPPLFINFNITEKLQKQTTNHIDLSMAWCWKICYGAKQFVTIYSIILISRADGIFKLWALVGLKSIGDRYPSNSLRFLSFGELQTKFRLELNVILTISSNHINLNKPPYTSLEKLMIKNKSGRALSQPFRMCWSLTHQRIPIPFFGL